MDTFKYFHIHFVIKDQNKVGEFKYFFILIQRLRTRAIFGSAINFSFILYEANVIENRQRLNKKNRQFLCRGTMSIIKSKENQNSCNIPDRFLYIHFFFIQFCIKLMRLNCVIYTK